jgi:glycosyltransferase involved in cell wall biosynthesis
MNIAVNTRLLLNNRLEGIGNFTYHTCKELVEKHPEHTFHFFFDRPFDSQFIFGSNVVPHILYPQARHPFLWYLYFEWATTYMLNKVKADCYLSPDGYLSLQTKCPSLAVIHDINFYHRPQDLPKLVGTYYNHYFPKFAHKATRIATVSEYSKNDIVSSYGIESSKVDVVYNGCDSSFQPLNTNDIDLVRKQYSNGCPYFLYIGSLHPRKNLKNLLLAFEQFKSTSSSNYKLIIVGNAMWKEQSDFDFIHQMKFKNEVIFLGYLPKEQLVKVTGAAEALTYVPFFEGFGIPIIEAFQSEIPVITSNVTSIPEVAGNAALLIDPNSIDQISDAMHTIYTNKDLKIKLIQKGEIQRQLFSWERTSKLLWESVEKVFSLK